MNKTLPSHYRLLTTKDGSPTLEFSPSGEPENMHNFHGAFSETNYIYGEALRKCISLDWLPRVLSVGLGLGYNEIMCAAFAERHNLEIQVISFEQDEFLRQSFSDWLTLSEENPLTKTYNQILNLYSAEFEISSEALLARLKRMLEDQTLQLNATFSTSSSSDEKCNVLLYDPFSSKTNPDFWSEAAIAETLSGWASRQCVLSTYAATGALKRALKNNDFNVEARAGFGGKRQSFLAVREASDS